MKTLVIHKTPLSTSFLTLNSFPNFPSCQKNENLISYVTLDARVGYM